MGDTHDSEILNILHPDLLSKDALVEKLQSRCCKVQNLCSLSKERLVELFRQMVLPLPQRLYRANRRGKMLNSRRTKESKKETQGSRNSDSYSKTSLSNTSYSQKDRRQSDLDRIVINDRRKGSVNVESRRDGVEEKRQKLDSSTNKKITLKRTSSDSQGSKTSSAISTDGKRQRTEIKWPRWTPK